MLLFAVVAVAVVLVVVVLVVVALVVPVVVALVVDDSLRGRPHGVWSFAGNKENP